MWELDIKKVECQRIDAFELWYWRLLGVPWTAGNQTSQSWRKSTLIFIGRTDSLSWSSNTLATWWEDLNHWKIPWCWERLRAGGEGSGRGWDGWMASPTQWTWVWASSGKWWRTGEAWCAAIHGAAKSRTQLSDWTTTTKVYDSLSKYDWVTVKQRLLGDWSFWWVTHGFSLRVKELWWIWGAGTQWDFRFAEVEKRIPHYPGFLQNWVLNVT